MIPFKKGLGMIHKFSLRWNLSRLCTFDFASIAFSRIRSSSEAVFKRNFRPVSCKLQAIGMFLSFFEW